MTQSHLKSKKNTSLILSTLVGINIFTSTLIWISGVGTKSQYIYNMVITIFVWFLYSSLGKRFKEKCYTSMIKIHTIIKHIKPIDYIKIISSSFFLIWVIKFFHDYNTFNIPTWDAGIYSNIVFNSSIGKFFYSSILEKNHLGEHFSPIMALFIPLYWIKADIRWILIIQALAYCIIPIMIYRLCNVYTNKINLKLFISIFLSIAWFLYTPMRSAMEFSGHPSSFVGPFILMAFIFLEEKKYLKLFITLALLLLFKENTMFITIGFGMYLIFKYKKVKSGIALSAAGILLIIILVKLVIPFFSIDGYQKLERLGIFYDYESKLIYIFKLFLPVFFLPIIFWRYGVITLPAILQNLIVNFEPMYSTNYHYDDLTSPLVFSCLPGIIICELIPLMRNIDFEYSKLLLIPLFTFLLFIAKPSPLQKVWEEPLTHIHNELNEDIINLISSFKTNKIYLQSPLFPHVNKRSTQDFKFCNERIKFKKNTIIALAPNAGLSHFNIKNLDQCLLDLKSDNNLNEIKGFKQLSIFQVQ